MVASLRMQNGSIAALSMTLSSRDELSRLRFCFEDLTAQSNLEPYTMYRDPWTFKAKDADLQKQIDAAIENVPDALNAYGGQFAAFHTTLEAGAPPPVTLTDARRALELVTAAYVSQQDSVVVKLPISKDHRAYASWKPTA